MEKINIEDNQSNEIIQENDPNHPETGEKSDQSERSRNQT